jgi:hypothetical protein
MRGKGLQRAVAQRKCPLSPPRHFAASAENSTVSCSSATRPLQHSGPARGDFRVQTLKTLEFKQGSRTFALDLNRPCHARVFCQRLTAQSQSPNRLRGGGPEGQEVWSAAATDSHGPAGPQDTGGRAGPRAEDREIVTRRKAGGRSGTGAGGLPQPRYSMRSPGRTGARRPSHRRVGVDPQGHPLAHRAPMLGPANRRRPAGAAPMDRIRLTLRGRIPSATGSEG